MSQATGPKPRADLSALRIDRSGESGLPRRRRRLPPWVLLALAALLTAAGAVFLHGRDLLGRVPVVRMATARLVSPARADSILTASGYLVSRVQAAIGAKAAGRVEKILVEEGMRVSRGDVLAVLEHADLDAARDGARASLSRSRADVAEAVALLAEDRRDLERKKNLFEAGVGPRQDREQAEAARDAQAARLESLREQVALAEARLREQEELLENMYIRAPFAGTVISKDAEIGETITPGGMGAASGRGSVVTLADLDHLEVETDVKEDYIGRIRVGQPARVQVDAVPGRTYAGRLRQIIPMGDRSRAVIQVKVEVVDADALLFPEMSASVHFLPAAVAPSPPAEAQPRVFVPAAAVVRRDGRSVVFTVRDRRARAVPVATGPARENLVEIREGLEGGVKVILNPPPDLIDGGRVHVALR